MIWHYINQMNGCAIFSTISSGAIIRMQKNTLFLFTEEETFWLPMTRRSGCRSCRSDYFLFMLDRQHKPKRHGKCCKYSENYNVKTDTSILTMICKRFIYLLTRNRSNDNPFLASNRPFQPSTFPATASRVCERDPSALEKVGATEGMLEIVATFTGDPKHTLDIYAHCILPIVVNISELSFLMSFYTVKNICCSRWQPRDCYVRIPFDLFS